jgi:uncharacterized membrane protein
MIESLLPGVKHLHNIHPLVVHFPIAFLVGTALFYGLAWILRSNSLATTAFTLLVAGVLFAAAAVGTGLYAEDGVMIARSVRDRLLETHETLMIITLCLAAALAIWAVAARPFPRKRRLLFLAMLLALVCVLSVGADYGARMVYDYNAGGNACSQPIEFSK